MTQAVVNLPLNDTIIDYIERNFEPKPLSAHFDQSWKERVDKITYERKLRKWRTIFKTVMGGVRRSTGKTQEEIAKGIGIPLNRYKRFERGCIIPFHLSMDTLVGLCSILKLRGKYLLSMMADYPLRKSCPKIRHERDRFLVGLQNGLKKAELW
jgi:hypothetical protein